MGIVGAFGSAVIAAVSLLAVLLLCGWAVFRLVGMWIGDRLISGGEFALIVSVFLVLMVLALSVGGWMALLLLFLLALVALLTPLMPAMSQSVRSRQMVRTDIARYQEALKRQPDVPYPHRKLGEIYEAQEQWDLAIEHYQAYLEQHEISAEVQRRLERCLVRKRRRDMGLRTCPVCGAENPADAVRCECGFYLRGGREILDVLTTPDMMRWWKWLIVIFLVPALLIGFVANMMPPTVSIIMLACSVTATLFFIHGRLRSHGGA